MIRLSKLTDYAIVLLGQMSLAPDARYSSTQLASDTGVPEPTVAKILKHLAAAGLVISFRGTTGGYQIQAPKTMTIRQVIEALDGPIRITDCAGSTGDTCCSAEGKCPMNSALGLGNWGRVNAAIIAALDSVTLLDMIPTPACTKTKFIQLAKAAE